MVARRLVTRTSCLQYLHQRGARRPARVIAWAAKGRPLLNKQPSLRSFFLVALLATGPVGVGACGANVVFVDENGQGASGAGASPSEGGRGAGSACEAPVPGEL